MMHKVMMVAAVLVACLIVAPAFGADEANDKPVHPEVKKLVDKLTADVDALTLDVGRVSGPARLDLSGGSDRSRDEGY